MTQLIMRNRNESEMHVKSWEKTWMDSQVNKTLKD